MIALYSVGTWDTDIQAYSPQDGLSVTSFNVPRAVLIMIIRELRSRGYSCHRFRDADGGHEDNDWSVIIERTDGLPEDDIRERWKR